MAPRRNQTPTTNPFSKREAIRPVIKALVRGPQGSGKSYLAFSSPGPVAVLDSEGSAQWYVDRPGFPELHVNEVASIDEVNASLDWLAKHPGEYATLVIDSASVLATVVVDAFYSGRLAKAVEAGKDTFDVDIELRDYGKMNRVGGQIKTRLIGLPLNIIVIAREKDEKDKQGNVRGTIADLPRGLAESDFAMVVRLEMRGRTRVATVIKDWTGTHEAMSQIEDPSWDSVFGPVLRTRQDAKGQVHAIDTVAAARASAKAALGVELPSEAEVASLVEALIEAGYDPEELRTARGWPTFSEMPKSKVVELTVWAMARAQRLAEQDGADGEAAPEDEKQPQEVAS